MKRCQPNTNNLRTRILQRLHPKIAKPSAKLYESARGEGSYEREYCVVLPDGPIRWIASRGRVEFDGTGNPVLMPGVSLDDTARRLAGQDRYGFASSPRKYPSENEMGSRD